MAYKREEINGVTPQDFKKLNDNLRYLWLKVFGDIDLTDMSQTAQTTINNKVGTNEVHSIIQQTPDDIKIGFNGINNVIDIDSTGLQVNHTDGSYTRMEGTGFNRYVGGTGKKYHYLLEVQELELDLGLSSDRMRNVTLPAEFKGKDFKVFSFFSRIYGSGGISEFECFIDNINKANATFTINSGVGDIQVGTNLIAYVIYIALA